MKRQEHTYVTIFFSRKLALWIIGGDSADIHPAGSDTYSTERQSQDSFLACQWDPIWRKNVDSPQRAI
jgi:hypothetical protein